MIQFERLIDPKADCSILQRLQIVQPSSINLPILIWNSHGSSFHGLVLRRRMFRCHFDCFLFFFAQLKIFHFTFLRISVRTFFCLFWCCCQCWCWGRIFRGRTAAQVGDEAAFRRWPFFRTFKLKERKGSIKLWQLVIYNLCNQS